MTDEMSHPVNLLEVLDGVRLPASKGDLVAYALNHDASEEVLEEIRAMPGDRYESVRDIANHAGLIESVPGGENLWSSADSHDFPEEADIAATEFRAQGPGPDPPILRKPLPAQVLSNAIA